MNLAKLFDMQKELGKVGLFAYKEPDRFNKLVLALLVELGECANEWRGFKFWSKDQEPRTMKKIKCKTCNGMGTAGSFACPDCANPYGGMQYTNPILEEYVDGKHFVLELGLEIDFKDYECLENMTNLECSIEELFIVVNAAITDLLFANDKDSMYIALFMLYNQLGKALGFTWEQIEQAYMEKNKVNHQRQEEGY